LSSAVHDFCFGERAAVFFEVFEVSLLIGYS
jgi:hypothetical protein